jgi:hypothetical protein
MKTAKDKKSHFFGLMRENFRAWYFEDCPIEGKRQSNTPSCRGALML